MTSMGGSGFLKTQEQVREQFVASELSMTSTVIADKNIKEEDVIMNDENMV